MADFHQDLDLFEPPVGSMWKHVKTGNTYEVTGMCKIEATNTVAVLYRDWSQPQSLPWARPLSEFKDGRFVRVGSSGEGA